MGRTRKQLQTGLRSQLTLPVHLINESLLNPGVTIWNIRKQDSGSGKIIPDPDFSIPDSGSRVKNAPDRGSATKSLSILILKTLTKLSEI